MKLEDVMNSPMLWVMSSLMVIVILTEAAVFMRQAFTSAEKMGIPKSECIRGARAAMITAVGPSFAPVIALMALMVSLGGPTAWMRMNDIGAARTELAMAAIATGQAGSSLKAGSMTLLGFVFALWGMALNNSGWIICGGYTAPYLKNGVDFMKKTFDAEWVKIMMAAAAMGLFSTLLGDSIISAKGAVNNRNLFCGVVAFIAMTLVSQIFKNNQRMQEFSLGLAMLIGMYATVVLTTNEIL